MRKITHEEFMKRMEERAPELDFSKFYYLGNAVKSTVVCPTHGEFEIAPNSLMNGVRCAKCYRDRQGLLRAKPFDDFLAEAKAIHGDVYGYKREDYTNATTPMRVYCKIHNKFFTTSPTRHINGQHTGCPICSSEKKSSSTRTPQEQFISKCRSVHGDTYDLTKVCYAGSTNKIEVICYKHGPFFPSAGNFIHSASGCPSCGRESVGKKSRKSYESYVDRFTSAHRGHYKYKRIDYEDSKAYVVAVCPSHGEFKQLAMDHVKGIGCAKCAFGVYDQESFLEKAAEVHKGIYDYSKSVYASAFDKVTIVCKEHGEFLQAPTDHVNNRQGCPRCGRVGPSKGQLEMQEYIEQYYPVSPNHRFWGRKEIDVFVEEQKVGFEYHGLIWHSEMTGKGPSHLKDRSSAAEKDGIRLIHIYADEWDYKRTIVEKLIRSALGVDRKIYARNTVALPIDGDTANAFLDNNHIQGAVFGAATHYGLIHNSELVAVMSFSRYISNRGKKQEKGQAELRRYASSCTVVGGASKLFKAFYVEHKEVMTVFSYSDNRMFLGNLYKTLEFEKGTVSPPSYWYITPGKKFRYNKAKFQKSKLKKMFGDKYDESLSEAENCARSKWYKIYDCGKTQWIWKRQ